MPSNIVLGLLNFVLFLDVYCCKDFSGLKDCYTGVPRNYNGTWRETKSGLECQRWDKQYPHEHSQQPSGFPEGNLCKAKNYCRDPDNTGFTWCYTMSPDVRWEQCDIPQCEVNEIEFDCYNFTEEELNGGRSDKEVCEINKYRTLSKCHPGCENCERCCQKKDCLDYGKSSHDYSGTWHRTKSGHQCQAWSSQYPHQHSNNQEYQFPDVTVEAARNYCRDPDYTGYPWCYTENPDVRWESCAIPSCH